MDGHVASQPLTGMRAVLTHYCTKTANGHYNWHKQQVVNGGSADADSLPSAVWSAY